MCLSVFNQQPIATAERKKKQRGHSKHSPKEGKNAPEVEHAH